MVLVLHALAVAAVAAGVAVLARFLLYYVHFRKLELAIPGPASLPLLGNILDFLGATPDTAFSIVQRLARGRGPLSRISLGSHLLVVVNSPEAVEKVVRRAELTHKAPAIYSMMEIPRGMVELNGPDWKFHRRAMEPGFNKNVLDRMLDIFNQEAKTLAALLPVHQPVDVVRPLRHALARIFVRTSISPDTTEFDTDVMKFVDLAEVFLQSLNKRLCNPLLWSERLFRLTPYGRTFLAEVAVVEETIRKAIAAKRECGENLAGERKTLADILFDLYDRGEITERDALDEVKLFFGASVETSGSTLSWMLKVLSIYPEVQDRVYAEVVAVLGDRDVSAMDLLELEYLERVLKEVMRLFPAIPLVGRLCPREMQLCDHVIPAGSSILVNIYAAHRDPDHWPDPERFDPDRFLPEQSQGRHRCAYIPFSSGARNCIGGKSAMMSMTTMLAVIVRAFKVLPVDDHHQDIRSLSAGMAMDVSSRLVGGTRVRFQPRGPVATT